MGIKEEFYDEREKNQKNYVDVIVNHYNSLKRTITHEELQTFYDSVYPDSRIKLTKEDWAICTIDIENNNSQKVCDYLEKVSNRIDITKTSSLQTSEIFINRLIKQLQPYQKDIYGSIEPFCDGREQGLMLSLYNQLTDDQFYIWSCESKTDKDLMVITSKEKNNQNLYMQDDLEKAQYFSKDNFDDAIDFSLSQVNQFLGKELNIKIQEVLWLNILM